MLATRCTVKDTVAAPVRPVTLVGDANDPPLLAFHVTTRAASATGWPKSSVS
jgi:hypothetical protein